MPRRHFGTLLPPFAISTQLKIETVRSPTSWRDWRVARLSNYVGGGVRSPRTSRLRPSRNGCSRSASRIDGSGAHVRKIAHESRTKRAQH